MAEFGQFEALRKDGFDANAAGLHLALTLREQAAFERQYARDVRGDPRGGIYPSGVPAPAKLHAEDDQDAADFHARRHVQTVLKLGGYPRAVLNERGHSEWIDHQNKRWGRKPRRVA